MTEVEAANSKLDGFAAEIDNAAAGLVEGSLLDDAGNAMVLAADLRLADGQAENVSEESRRKFLANFREFSKNKENASLVKKTLDAFLTFALPQEWGLMTMSPELVDYVLGFYREEMEGLRKTGGDEYDRTAKMFSHVLEKAVGQARLKEDDLDKDERLDTLLMTWGEEVDYPESLIEGIKQMMTAEDYVVAERYTQKLFERTGEELKKKKENRE